MMVGMKRARFISLSLEIWCAVSQKLLSLICYIKDISFEYERPLYADDSTMYLPDFTIRWKGEIYYWEHLGMLDIGVTPKMEPKRAVV